MSNFDADYYAANYPDYERQNPLRKLQFYRRCVEQSLLPNVPRRIHDIGCAFGNFLRVMPSDWQRYGTDPSQHAIRAGQSASVGIELAVATAGDQPFGHDFGVVTAFDVLEHVPDLSATARAIAGQLRTGGSFLFVVPVYDGLSGPVIRRLDRDETHLHRWPRGAWLDWASQNFELVDWLGIMRWFPPWKRYLHLPTRLIRHHSPAILAICRKPQ